MGRAFTDEENQKNIEVLKLTGRKLAVRNGFKKSSVDELVRLCGISKGQFYRYFSCKEEFYFKIRMDVKRELDNMTLCELNSDQPVTRPKLTECLFRHFSRSLVQDNSIFFNYDELKYLFDKVPEELINQSMQSKIEGIVNIVNCIDQSVSLPYDKYKILLSIIKSTSVVACSINNVSNDDAVTLMRFHSQAISDLILNYIEKSHARSDQTGKN